MRDPSDSPLTFAHRGVRLDAPENTVEAFRLGLVAGARGLETDVWLSADGEVVCVHDATVGRGLRRKKVRESTAAELAEFAAVPRLADVYAELGTGFALSVDAKHPEVVGPLLSVAEAAGATDHLWLCLETLEELTTWRPVTAAKLVHSRRKAYLEGQIERHAHVLADLGVDAMNMHQTDWSGGLVSLFHRYEVACFGWDAQEVRHIRALLGMKIDGIYCDRPDRLVATVSEFTDRH